METRVIIIIGQLQYLLFLSFCAARNDISNMGSIISLFELHDYSGMLKNVNDLDEEYAFCVNNKLSTNTQGSIFGPFYKFSLVNDIVSLPCSPCRYSSRPYPKWIKLSFENVKTEIEPNSKYQIENEDTLIINYVSKSDFGTYYCVVNEHVGYIWSLEVESYEHLQVVGAKLWEKNKDSKSTHFPTMKIDVEWQDWEPCNKCNFVGKRHRLGYCYVHKSTNSTDPLDPASYEVIDVYINGLSCNLFYLNHPKQDIDVLRALMRGSYIMLDFCKVACEDVNIDPHTKFKRLPSKIQDFYKVDLKALAEEEELNDEFNQRSARHGKFHPFSIIPRRNPTKFEWFLLISLFLFQGYILIHVCKNRSKAK